MPTPRRWVPRPDVEIEAEPWTGDWLDLPEEWRALDLLYIDDRGRLVVVTPDGATYPSVGTWVARGTAGEMYPIRRPIFEGKYMPAGSANNGNGEQMEWTPEQVALTYKAQYPHLNAKRIRQLVREGVIPHIRRGRGSIWLDQASVDALLAHGRQGGQ